MTGQTENAAMAAAHVATLKGLPPEVVHGHGPVFGRRADTGGEHRPRLPAQARQPRRGHALARPDRAQARCARRCRATARGRPRARTRLSGRPPRLCPGAAGAAQVPAGPRGAREAFAARAREQGISDALREHLCRPRRTREGPAALPGTAHRRTAGAPICTCRSPIASRRSGDSRRPSRLIAPLRLPARILAMPIGVSRTSRPIALRTRRSRACTARKRRRPPGSSIAIISASRSARPSRTGASTQESFRYYERGNALKRSESRYRPEPFERNTRLQSEVCTRGVLRGPRGLRIPERRSDLHRGTAPRRVHTARADPRLAFARRGHA